MKTNDELKEKLKKYIIQKHGNVRNFARLVDMGYSTITTLLKRGVDGARLETVYKLCTALEIDITELAKGNVCPMSVSEEAPLTFQEKEVIAALRAQPNRMEPVRVLLKLE